MSRPRVPLRSPNANAALMALANGQTVGSDPVVVSPKISNSSDVVEGLGLKDDAKEALRARVEDWLSSSTPAQASKAMIHDLRGAFPKDHHRRREVMRRAMQLLKKQRVVERWPTVQKGLAAGQQRMAPQGAGGHGRAQIGEVHQWGGQSWRKVAEGKWEPVTQGRQPGKPKEAAERKPGALADRLKQQMTVKPGAKPRQAPPKPEQQAVDDEHVSSPTSPDHLKEMMAAAIKAHGADAVKAAVLDAGKDIAQHADEQMQTAAKTIADKPSVGKVVKRVMGKTGISKKKDMVGVSRSKVDQVAKELRKDPEVVQAAKGELTKMQDGIAEAAADAVEKAAGDPSHTPSKTRAVVKAILKGGAGAFMFGFLDNFILYIAGAGIDKAIAAAGFSAAAVAGLGNAVSDTVGKLGEKQIDKVMDKMGLGEEKTGGVLKPETEEKIKKWSASIGIFAGCIAGMVPLLFGMSFGKSARPRPILKLSTWGYFGGKMPSGTLEAVLVESPLTKGVGHKYVKRIPTGKPKPKYRYYYSIPGRGLVSSEDLKAGTKIKGEHVGKVGHFEVEHHDKEKQIVRLKHDESGKIAHIKERDLHRMTEAYHKRAGTKQARAPKEKEKAPPLKLKPQETQVTIKTPMEQKPEAPAPAALKAISMDDLGAGGWEEIVGFAPTPEAAAQMAAKRKGVEHAIVKQPAGYVVAARKEVARARTTDRSVGADTNVFMRDKSGKGVAKLKSKFVVVEADKLIASHDPLTMAPRDDYPKDVQERRYHELTGEQMKVHRIASSMEPQIVVNSNPDGVNGTPVVTKDNIVLGGNGRTMAQQLAYAKHPESAKKLKEYLAQQARQFGLSPAEIQQMKSPILVRQIETGDDTASMRKLGRRLNESLTQGLDPRTTEVALGKNYVTQELVGSLVTEMEADQTLAEFLHSPKSADFTKALERAGIIDDLNRDEFVDAESGLLNEDGRLRVERVLAARFIPDASILSKMSQATRQNIAKSVPYLLRAQAAGWDIQESMMSAVKADLDYRAQSKIKTPDLYIRQVVSEKLSPDHPALALGKDKLAGRLWEVLQKYNGPRKMAAGFREFARRAESSKDAAGLTMFMAEPENPEQALDRSFGLSPEAKKDIAAQKKVAKVEQDKLEAEFGITAAMKRKPKAKASAEAQPAMFSVRDYPTLIKAIKPEHSSAYLMNAVVGEVRHLMDANLSTAGATNSPLRIDGGQIRMKVGEAIHYAAERDPDIATALQRRPLRKRQVDGIVQAMAEIYGGKLSKALAWWQGTEAIRKARRSYPCLRM